MSVNDGSAGERSLKRVVTRQAILRRNVFHTSSVIVRADVTHRFLEGSRASEDYYLWCKVILGHRVAVRLEPQLSFRYSHSFGGSGLSGRLLAMEVGELQTLRLLLREGDVSLIEWFGASARSFAKFIRRILIVLVRRAIAVWNVIA